MNETNSWLAKKKNESNFLSSNCTRFTGALLAGAYASHSEAATGRHLHDRAAACGARASRATKTVIAGHDLAIFERIRVEVPQKDLLAIVPLHPELLIEIAVINFTTPPNADRVPAHETVDRRWIECLYQKLHVLIESIAVAQISGETADRKIRKRVKPVEHNSEMLLQLPFVIGLKLTLAAMAKTRPRGYKRDGTAAPGQFRSLTSSKVASPRCCLRIRRRRVARSHFPLSNTASTQ